MIEADWYPPLPKLARFGHFAPIGFGILGLLVAWRSGAFSGESNWTGPILIWAIGLIIFTLSWIVPKVLLPVYWIMFGIGWLFFTLLGHLAMALIFFLVITPVALFFRIIGRDELKCKTDSGASSYWSRIQKTKPKESYFRQS